jgi:hypothetical protein
MIMGNNDSAAALSRRRKHLAVGVAAILGLASPAAFATVFVTNCNDSGVGSLRNAIAGAPSGETVDASGLLNVCSKITLNTGALAVPQTNLTIKGPGPESLYVTAKYGTFPNTTQYFNRIFTHTGTGLLYLQGISATKGYQNVSPFAGGCISSAGSVKLKNVNVTGCTVQGTNGAIGGGVNVAGTLTMTQSSITFSTANGGSSSGRGGGVATHGLRAYYSTIDLNSATDTPGTGGFAGGVYSAGDTFVFNSTIGPNKADSNIGGLGVIGGSVKIVNSTISSNAAKGVVGGLYANSTSVQIFNSTITANTAGSATVSQAPGAQFNSASPATVTMQSSIIAGNLYGDPPTVDNDLSSAFAITGNNNLVQQSTASLPVDTIVGKCAFLGPLALNGGLTETHKVLGHSPAIDKGNNTNGAAYDQRGQLSVNGESNYPRVSGPPGGTPRADIGAYEINRSDEIFDAIFENC